VESGLLGKEVMMQGVIDKVCSQLITNPHIIGIILDCNNIPKETLHIPFEDIELENGRIDLCIISREAGNQKTIYMEDDYLVCLWWRSEEEFLELAQSNQSDDIKKILYDKTGLLKKVLGNVQLV